MSSAPDNQTLLCTLVRHYEELVDYVRRRFTGRSFARDVVHDLCIQLLEKPSRTTARQPLALLRRATLYRAIDRQRAEASYSGLVACVETLPDVPVQTHEPLERLLWRQRLEALRQAIEALPPRCRQVFLLHRLYDMPQAEVAEALGVSRNMVARHMMRAMQSLAPLLEPELKAGSASGLPRQQPCAMPASLPHALTSTADGQAI